MRVKWGTSIVIKTEHTMITLLASTTAMAVLDFGLPARRRKAATLSETIWRLAREMSSNGPVLYGLRWLKVTRVRFQPEAALSVIA